MSIYEQIKAATDEDQAYYLARASHRRRNDTIETQIWAAVGDAISQYHLGRVEFARTIAGILDNLPMSDGVARCTAAPRNELASLLA